MDIDLGSRMIIEFANKDRMNCQFIGLLKDEFLLIKVPLTPGIKDRMAEGVSLYCRYLKAGKIISFRADVLRHQVAPVSLAFLSYPSVMQEHNLRKEGRVECNLPTKLAVGGRASTGRIVDINTGGCRFVFDEGSEIATKEGISANGSFVTLEGSKDYEFKGTVAAIQNGGSSLGIRFEGEVALPEKLQELLDDCCTLADEEG